MMQQKIQQLTQLIARNLLVTATLAATLWAGSASAIQGGEFVPAEDRLHEIIVKIYRQSRVDVYQNIYGRETVVRAFVTPKVHVCTGTYITGQKILTAAHCFEFHPTRYFAELEPERQRDGIVRYSERYIATVQFFDPRNPERVADEIESTAIIKHTDYEDSTRPGVRLSYGEKQDVAIIQLPRAPRDGRRPFDINESMSLALNTPAPSQMLVAGYGLLNEREFSPGLKRARLERLRGGLPNCLVPRNDLRTYSAFLSCVAADEQRVDLPPEPPIGNSGGGDSGGPTFYYDQEGRIILRGVLSMGSNVSETNQIPWTCYEGLSNYENRAWLRRYLY